jgi:hypothetical protein
LSIELTIKPLGLGGGYKYRMLDMLCAEALVIGIVRMLLKRQPLFSTGYGVSASLNATFFALVLARLEPLLNLFLQAAVAARGKYPPKALILSNRALLQIQAS